MRPKPEALVVLLIALLSGCQNRKSVPGLKPDETHGVVTIRYATQQTADVDVSVCENFSCAASRLNKFPASISVPYGNQVRVRVDKNGFFPFQQEILVTRENAKIDVVIRLKEMPTAFGVLPSTIPKSSGIRIVSPSRPGKPSSALFSFVSVSSHAGVGAPFLIVDDRARVWRDEAPTKKPGVEYVLVGELAVETLAAMRLLCSEAATGVMVGERTVLEDGPAGEIRAICEFGLVAYDGHERGYRKSPATMPLLAWMLSLDREVSESVESQDVREFMQSL